MTIHYVPHDLIYPHFGKCYSDGRVEIDESLPERVKRALCIHEPHHYYDKETGEWWVEEELEANWEMFRKEPIATLWIIWNTLIDPKRRELYWQRAKEGK